MHLLSHYTGEEIEQYRVGIDVRLSNVLVRKAAGFSSVCACLLLPLFCSDEKLQTSSDWLI